MHKLPALIAEAEFLQSPSLLYQTKPWSGQLVRLLPDHIRSERLAGISLGLGHFEFS